MKDRKIARPEWTMCLDSKEGAVADQTKMAALPVGSKLPAYRYKTDICMECGCIYAINISRSEATVGLKPATQMPMNRADRRRGGFDPPFGQG